MVRGAISTAVVEAERPLLGERGTLIPLVRGYVRFNLGDRPPLVKAVTGGVMSAEVRDPLVARGGGQVYNDKSLHTCVEV